jgi:hypothetical protein
VSLFGHLLFYFGFMCLAAAAAYVFVLPICIFAAPKVFFGLLLTIPIVVPGLAALPFGAQVVIYGRRMRAMDAVTLLSRDHRAPVLVLRSFDDEDLPDPTFRGGKRNPFIPQRYEEQIVSVLGRIGPVISIGIPGERRAELGAARLYVCEEHWQAAVRHFAQNSAAIILAMGRTQSLWWEIDLVLSSVKREHVLFFFPYADEPDRRRTFWRKYYNIIPSIMPGSLFERVEAERQARYELLRERTKDKSSGSWPDRLGDAQFLDFVDSGSPRLLLTKRPLMALLYMLWMRKTVSTWIHVEATLRPFITKVTRS